jgi:hypothetical protein
MLQYGGSERMLTAGCAGNGSFMAMRLRGCISVPNPLLSLATVRHNRPMFYCIGG